MGAPAESWLWEAQPGDWVIGESHGEFIRVIRRTPNDLEAQRIIGEFESAGRKVIVLRVKGVV